jgi:hypothetical protein
MFWFSAFFIRTTAILAKNPHQTSSFPPYTPSQEEVMTGWFSS